MKNDLTPFEKDLLRSINRTHGTRFTYKHLMGWGADKVLFQKTLQPDEVVYNVFGCYVAIKPDKK
jgi:hypothetical protein